MGKWKFGQHFNSTATALNSTFANPCKPTRKPKFAKKLFLPSHPEQLDDFILKYKMNL
jgi:hypothetical protein